MGSKINKLDRNVLAVVVSTAAAAAINPKITFSTWSSDPALPVAFGANVVGVAAEISNDDEGHEQAVIKLTCEAAKVRKYWLEPLIKAATTMQETGSCEGIPSHFLREAALVAGRTDLLGEEHRHPLDALAAGFPQDYPTLFAARKKLKELNEKAMNVDAGGESGEDD